MVIGIKCSEEGDISFETCMECEKCLPKTLIAALKQYDFRTHPDRYNISEILRCQRQVFYDRTIGPKNEYIPLEVLWMRKRGKYFETILERTDINDVTGILVVDVDGQTVQIRGKLDGFSQYSKELIEVKSTRISVDFVPREKDMLQLQCYVSLYKDIFKEIRGLRLVYLGMSNFKTFDIEMVDQTDFITSRVRDLHTCIVDSVLPEKEESRNCRYCVFKDECAGGYSTHIETEIVVKSE
ncbi:MAG: PD-(D/E)XK nuclease family protein [Candidatus Bathyarchaeota archaeon]|nr:PD-(D/E)XK nuclease family protein [Candidatus Bathyarchaeota archaeon]